MPKNYWPIPIIPLLSKLYSSVLLGRIATILETAKTPEEMGFRKGYACGDLIHCLRMVSEKSIEWGESVWVASIDLEKAFDKIIHDAVFPASEQVAFMKTTFTQYGSCIWNNELTFS